MDFVFAYLAATHYSDKIKQIHFLKTAKFSSFLCWASLAAAHTGSAGVLTLIILHLFILKCFAPLVLWRYSFPAILSLIWDFSAGDWPSQSLQLVQTQLGDVFVLHIAENKPGGLTQPCSSARWTQHVLLRRLLSFLQLQNELWYIPVFSLENLCVWLGAFSCPPAAGLVLCCCSFLFILIYEVHQQKSWTLKEHIRSSGLQYAKLPIRRSSTLQFSLCLMCK